MRLPDHVRVLESISPTAARCRPRNPEAHLPVLYGPVLSCMGRFGLTVGTKPNATHIALVLGCGRSVPPTPHDYGDELSYTHHDWPVAAGIQKRMRRRQRCGPRVSQRSAPTSTFWAGVGVDLVPLSTGRTESSS